MNSVEIPVKKAHKYIYFILNFFKLKEYSTNNFQYTKKKIKGNVNPKNDAYKKSLHVPAKLNW
ncbi:MAG: hypothetical protein LUH05_05930 [Candidatus Gastranaerophilales bacterium]|nr:hypothetical protein [Candidatus Gastranaerophilales bacterium]